MVWGNGVCCDGGSFIELVINMQTPFTTNYLGLNAVNLLLCWCLDDNYLYVALKKNSLLYFAPLTI